MSEDIIRYVNAAAQGDTDAMAKLYAKTLKSSYYLALKLCGDMDEASEITKNAYARVFCTISRLKKLDAFEIFMRQNIAAVYKEGRKFTFGDAVSDVPESSLEFLSEDVYADEKKSAAALAAVASLSPELRSAVVLHYLSGMPVAPLSKYLNVSESTANAVLAKAKEVIFEKCSSGEPYTSAEGTYPVLNRIFKRELESVVIDNAVVRDMFIYVMDKYNTFKELESKKVPVTTRTSGEFFKNAGSEPSVPAKSDAPVEPSAEEDIDFDRFVDQPVIKKEANKKFDLAGIVSAIKNIDWKHLDYKKIAIIAAIVIAVILVIAGIGKAKSKKNDNPGTSVSTSSDEKYVWKEGGFSDCTEIKYVNEYFCCFKSATTGKYGLLDYQGNVLIQPRYDNEFLSCGDGRDYTNSHKYHVVIKIDGTDYIVSYSGGRAEITGEVHNGHSFNNDVLPDGVKYDDRDRYFDGYAAAEKNGKWGYVDADGKKVIPYQYEAVNVQSGTDSQLTAYNSDYCRPVSNNLVPVRKNGNMGIINLKNETVVPFEYSEIMPGSDGVYIARKNGTWGVIVTGKAIDTFAGVNMLIDTSDDEVTTEAGETYYIVKGSGSGVNVRAEADGNATIVGELMSGTEVKGCGTKKAENGNIWLRIEFNNAYAYISMKLVEEKN